MVSEGSFESQVYHAYVFSAKPVLYILKEPMNQDPPTLESNSLETPEPVQAAPAAEPAAGSVPQTPLDTGVVNPDAPKSSQYGPKEKLLGRILGKLNIYTFLLIIVLLILGIATFFALRQNRTAHNNSALKTQELTQEAIDRLAETSPTVGSTSETLNIASNAIFNGSILVKGAIDVAGGLKIGSALSLPTINVGETATVELLAAKRVTVAGDTAVQGKMTIQNGLSVIGGGSFSGPLSASQVSTDKLQLNGDLQLTQHIDPNGASPGRTNGSALGSGGTASVSGTDTAGTVVINTGNSAPAGCFVTVNFTKAFSATPHVVISPSSSTAGTLSYYTNRTTTSFSVCSAGDPPDNTANISFDYIVID